MGSIVCALPQFAGFQPVSDQYLTHLNNALRAQGSGLEVRRPLGVENTHDSFVQVNLVGSLGEAVGIHLPPIESQLRKAQEAVETQRRAASLASAQTVAVAQNPTLDRMSHLNAAESAWLERVAGPLADIANALYAAQTDLRQSTYSNYMNGPSEDQAAQWNFARTRSPLQPSLADDAQQSFNNALPWFPQGPAYSAMLPEDFTQTEVAYLLNWYGPEHPARLPYTIIERMEASHVSLTPIVNAQGIETEWHIPAENGGWYRVVHMRFHPRYAALFESAANLLEESASLSVGHQTLDPGFKAYTLSMADCIRRGDFLRMLEDDLNQTSGNIFLSFFPHESDWADQIKNPWELVVGVRDQTITQSLQANALLVYQKMQERVAAIAEEVGAPIPMSFAESREEVLRLAEVVWAVRTGGWFRAFADGDVGGHDYPKIEMERFAGRRRAVILADSEAVRIPVREALARNLFSDAAVSMVDILLRLRNTAFHEIAHAFNRPDILAQGGQAMSLQFAPSFWAFGEPHSDASIGAALSFLFQAGQMGEEEMQKSFFNFLLRALQMTNKKNFLGKLESGGRKFGNDHAFGLTLLIGRLFKEGVLRFEDGELQIDYENIGKKSEETWEHFVRLGFTGTWEDYRAFALDCMQAIPDDAVQVINAGKPPIQRTIVDRGDVGPLII